MRSENINRRGFLRLAGATAAGTLALPVGGSLKAKGFGEGRAANKPNFIIIFCDDLGYGDVGCFGSKKHRTPNIDKALKLPEISPYQI